MPSLMATSFRWRTHSARTNFHWRQGGRLSQVCGRQTLRPPRHQQKFLVHIWGGGHFFQSLHSNQFSAFGYQSWKSELDLEIYNFPSQTFTFHRFKVEKKVWFLFVYNFIWWNMMRMHIFPCECHFFWSLLSSAESFRAKFIKQNVFGWFRNVCIGF